MDPQTSIASGYLLAGALAQFVTFLGVLAGLVFGYLRDGRTRQWLKEDRDYSAAETARTAATLAARTAEAAADRQRQHEATAREAIRTADALASHTSQVAAELKVVALERSAIVTKALDDISTELAATRAAADDAYHEANTVNLKLEALGLAHNELERAAVAAAAAAAAAGKSKK